jgi:hypothetical protein
LIYYGSGTGSSMFAQTGSGSRTGSKLKQNFRRQFLYQIFLKSKFESNHIKNIGVIHLNFFQKVVSAILYLFSGKIFKKLTKKCFFPLKFLSFLAPGSVSGFPIQIRIHKVSESGSGSTTLLQINIVSGSATLLSTSRTNYRIFDKLSGLPY